MGNQEYVNIKWQDGTIPEVGRNGVQVAEAIEVVLNQYIAKGAIRWQWESRPLSNM